MRDRSMRGGTELVQEIQLTDYHHWRNLSQFSQGKKSPFDRPNYTSFEFFSIEENAEKLLRFDKQKLFFNFFLIRPLHVASKPV